MRLLFKTITRTSFSHYSTKTRSDVTKTVYFSKCTDIFTNLALEDWLYKNMDFTNRQLLMLWRNEPCVVIGRHQNPWLECNFAALPNIGRGVKLARRDSGGGTVYHDIDNLNLSFFTSREKYSRRLNLELISRALKNGFDIHSAINQREDLCIGDFKISGTASKLGTTTAYHHCTLLVNANKENLSLALKNIVGDHVKTNASVSVRSRIMNLSEVAPGITVDQVIEAVITEYNKTSEESCLKNGGVKTIEAIDDESFAGVSEIKAMFLSDAWKFERTPKFTISRHLFNDSLVNGVFAFLVVEKGRISDAGISAKLIKLSVQDNNLRDLSDLFSGIMEKPFSKQVLDEFDMMVLGLRSSEKCRVMIVNS